MGFMLFERRFEMREICGKEIPKNDKYFCSKECSDAYIASWE